MEVKKNSNEDGGVTKFGRSEKRSKVLGYKGRSCRPQWRPKSSKSAIACRGGGSSVHASDDKNDINCKKFRVIFFYGW